MSQKIQGPGSTPSRKAAKLSRAKPARSKKSTRAKAPLKVATGFSSKAAAPVAQEGQPLKGSAAPGNLWAEPRPAPPTASQLNRLSSAARAEKLSELKEQKAALETQISDRVDTLWSRLTHRTLGFRAEIYKSLKSHPNMPAQNRRELEGLLARSDQSLSKLDQLKARAEGLAKTGSPQNTAERTALAKQLLAVRAEHRSCVRAAETLVDRSGLKLELLLGAESKIAPETPKERSLTQLFLEWVGIVEALSTFESVIRPQLESAKQQQEQHHEVLEIEKRVDLRYDWLRALARSA